MPRAAAVMVRLTRLVLPVAMEPVPLHLGRTMRPLSVVRSSFNSRPFPRRPLETTTPLARALRFKVRQYTT